MRTGLQYCLANVLKNVLQFGDDTTVKQVVELVKGAAGIAILQLLIRANDPGGVKWILNSDSMHASKPPPILWDLLCDYFLSHPNPEALDLFTRVAHFLVEKAIRTRVILIGLNAHNFSLVKQVICDLRR